MIKNILKNIPFILLGIYLVEFVLLSINPFDRATWWAENLPVLVAVLVLAFTFKKFRFSNTAYVLMAFFLTFHTIGGHFTFERVPFDFFNNLLSCLNMDFMFPEGRNNFDRVGHYMVGFFAYPIAELLWRKRWLSKISLAILFGIFALGFWGALYEVIEMYYAVSVGGEAGASFLGSQGDIWDAQKDMWLDILGAMTVSVLFWWKYKGR